MLPLCHIGFTVPSDSHREGCQVPGQAGPPGSPYAKSMAVAAAWTLLPPLTSTMTLTEALLGTFAACILQICSMGLDDACIHDWQSD